MPLNPSSQSPGQVSNEPLVANLLSHQSTECVRLLTKAPDLYAQLQASENLKEWVTQGALKSPAAVVDWVMQEQIDRLRRTMQELRNCYQKASEACNDEETKNGVAAATAALYLLCVCRMVDVTGLLPLVPVPVPEMEQDEAVMLIASIVSVSLAGGRIQLRSDDSNGIPLTTGTYSVRLEGLDPDTEFERGLHTLVFLGLKATKGGLKKGSLTDQERADLVLALQDIRNEGVELQALTLVVFCPANLSTQGFRLASRLNIPVFRAASGVSLTVLGGMTPVDLVAQLKLLWRILRDNLRYKDASIAQTQSEALKEMLDLLKQLAAQANNEAADEISAFIGEAEKAGSAGSKPNRSLLEKIHNVVSKITAIGGGVGALAKQASDLINYLKGFQ